MTPLEWAVLAIFAAVALALAILARTARAPRVVCPICHQPVRPEYWCDGHATHMLLSRSGRIITIGCETRGGFIEFELTPEVAHLVWHFLDGIPDARTCEECAQ